MSSEPRFFTSPPTVSAAQIADRIGADVVGDGAVMVANVAPLDLAGPQDLTFLDNEKYAKQLADTKASVCILADKHRSKLPSGVVGLIVSEPYRAYTQVARWFYPEAARPQTLVETNLISPAAIVDETARLEDGVTVDPGAVIGPRVEIGSGSRIGANTVIGADVRIGRDCSIAANVTVSHALLGDRVYLYPGVRIGQDGFGYAMGPAGHLKVPQIGRVILQNDVEIGANSTIDRGANRDTIIGEGSKIDNQVQIGHNVQVGRHCVLVSQSGISGSTILEDYVVLGGKVGLTGHIRVGMGAQLAGGALVSNDVPAGGKWVGIPAQPLKSWTKERMFLKKVARGDKKHKEAE